MTITVLGLVAAYVVVAILLLSLNLASRWKWWIKGMAVIVVSILYAASYFLISDLRGWPAVASLPDRFQLHWAKIVEPNKFTGEPGILFLWVEALDDDNIPLGTPRAFRLPYSDELANDLLVALGRIEDGDEVAGEVQEAEEEGTEEEEDPDAENAELQDREESGGGFDVEAFPDDPLVIEFGDLPAPALPEKDVI